MPLIVNESNRPITLTPKGDIIHIPATTYVPPKVGSVEVTKKQMDNLKKSKVFNALVNRSQISIGKSRKNVDLEGAKAKGKTTEKKKPKELDPTEDQKKVKGGTKIGHDVKLELPKKGGDE